MLVNYTTTFILNKIIAKYLKPFKTFLNLNMHNFHIM